MRTFLSILTAAAIAAAMLVPGPSRADTTTTRVTLPVDQKLVGVSWRCEDSVCRPWFLMRLMERKESARSYTFSEGWRMILVTETREPGNWQWKTVRTVTLPRGQRLTGVSWRCGPSGACFPWYLMRPLNGARPRSYTFTDDENVILIRERALRR